MNLVPLYPSVPINPYCTFQMAMTDKEKIVSPGGGADPTTYVDGSSLYCRPCVVPGTGTPNCIGGNHPVTTQPVYVKTNFFEKYCPMTLNTPSSTVFTLPYWSTDGFGIYTWFYYYYGTNQIHIDGSGTWVEEGTAPGNTFNRIYFNIDFYTGCASISVGSWFNGAYNSATALDPGIAWGPPWTTYNSIAHYPGYTMVNQVGWPTESGLFGGASGFGVYPDQTFLYSPNYVEGSSTSINVQLGFDYRASPPNNDPTNLWPGGQVQSLNLDPYWVMAWWD